MKFNRYALTSAPTPEVAKSYAVLLDAQVSNLSAILDKFTERAESIRTDGKFTPAGQSEEIAKVGREALAELEKIVQHPREKLTLDLKRVGGPSRLPTFRQIADERKEDPVVLFLRHKELREYLKTLDPLEQRPALLDAAHNDDVDLLAAASDVHPVLRPVRAELLEEVTRVWVDARVPEEGKVIATTREVYESNVRSAQRVIARRAGIATGTDPIAQLASGGAAA